jgi:membrane associated rhomboid family serine protease
MSGEWTTADYALIVSLCSAAVSLLSFGWSVWSKFIFPKPSVAVQFGVCGLVEGLAAIVYVWRPATTLFDGHDLGRLRLPAMVLKATNLGPSPVRLTSVAFKTGGWWNTRRNGYAFVVAYKDYPEDLKNYRISPPDTTLQPGDSLELFFSNYG